ncbi:MAG: trehalose-phosphatase [Planctomycetota bacterium]|jgi:trehalose 6-phosphate synthase/phosphatase
MTPPSAIDGWRALAAPELLLALDYDGTLVAIVPRPEDARPDQEALDLLAALEAAPGLRLAVLSGRPVGTLDDWLGMSGALLIGTHGAEWRAPRGRAEPLLAPEEARHAAREAADALERALGSIPGSQVEPKEYGVAAHYRRVEESDRPGWRRAFDGVVARVDPRYAVHEGKCVLELRFRGVEKGRALLEARRRLGWEGLPVLALGDDRTDEATFSSLGPDDLSVHVGPGPTGAARSVPDVASARTLLLDLIRVRHRIGQESGG